MAKGCGMRYVKAVFTLTATCTSITTPTTTTTSIAARAATAAIKSKSSSNDRGNNDFHSRIVFWSTVPLPGQAGRSSRPVPPVLLAHCTLHNLQFFCTFGWRDAVGSSDGTWTTAGCSSRKKQPPTPDDDDCNADDHDWDDHDDHDKSIIIRWRVPQDAGGCQGGRDQCRCSM